ncbi:hypothetical protein GQ457_03G011770 [Hibiscus cannabinus]
MKISESDKMEEIMLPGFRFHPTYEELVGFYLKRKIQQRPLSYRVTSLTDSAPPKRYLDKCLPANDSWAICRIFKKTNSTAQRAPCHSWVSPILETSSISDMVSRGSNSSQLSSDNIGLTTKTSSSPVQFSLNHNTDLLQTCSASFSPLDFVPYKPINQMTAEKLPQVLPMSNGDLTSLIFAPLDQTSPPAKSAVDVTSYEREHGDRLRDDHENMNVAHVDDQWDAIRSVGFPFSLPLPMSVADAWKPSISWDSSCCVRYQHSFSSTKCHT